MMNEQAKSKTSHLVEHAVAIAKVVFYFFCCLIILQTFRCATLMVAKDENEFLAAYATAALTALVLGKTVFILERVSITKMLDHKPVYAAVIYKTILFTLFTDFVLALEHLIKHHAFTLVDPHKGAFQYAVCFGAHQLALAVAFGLFFSARELDAVLGGGQIARLFFSQRKHLMVGHEEVTADLSAVQDPEKNPARPPKHQQERSSAS
jgi:hypothetical protein